MKNYKPELTKDTLSILCEEFKKNNYIDPEDNEKYQVKRGLRNPDGTGVLAGLTRICTVHGYIMSENERVPVDGKLIYRGIDVADIVNGCTADNRFSFEETCWLLLFGELPTKDQLEWFNQLISECAASIFCRGYDHQSTLTGYYEQAGTQCACFIFL